MKHHNAFTTTSLTLAVAVLALAACGDSDEPLSKAEFIEQADAICAATQAEMNPVFEGIWVGLDDVDFDDPANEFLVHQRWAEAADQLVPIVDDQLEDIENLGPPADDEDFVAGIIAEQRDAMTEFSSVVHAAADGNEEALQAMEDLDPFVDIDRRLREYGLAVCGAEG